LDLPGDRIFVALITFIIILPLISAGIEYVLAPLSASLGLLDRGLGVPNCVTIVLRDPTLIYNGSRFSGNIVVSFGREIKIVHLSDAVRRDGRTTLCFGEGIRDEIERLRKIYRGAGVELTESGFVKGLTGDEVFHKLESRYGSIALPTIHITLWLYDDGGYIYVYSAGVTAIEYYRSKTSEPPEFNPYTEALRDPFAHVRNGVTVYIPPLRDLYPYLARINVTPAVMDVEKSLGLGGAMQKVIEAHRFSVASGVPLLDGYIYNYWQLPLTPPKFWRDRVATLSGVEEEKAENMTWQSFVELYGSAYLFSKDMFPTPGSVRDYLNNFKCLREGPKPIDEVLRECLNPESLELTWINTLESGTSFTFLKVFILALNASATSPDIGIGLEYSPVGVRQQGITLMGAYILGSKLVATGIYGGDFEEISPDYDYAKGWGYKGFAIPSQMYYYRDVLMLVYDVRSYNATHWIAIPIPILLPYYIENIEVETKPCDSGSLCIESHYLRFYRNGSCENYTCKYINNVVDYVRRISKVIAVDEYVLVNKSYVDLLRIASKDSVLEHSQLIKLAAPSLGMALFSVPEELLSKMFGVSVDAWRSDPVLSRFGAFIASFISFSDLDMYYYGGRLKLTILASLDSFKPEHQNVWITIKKLTLRYASDTYHSVGKAPTAYMYIIVVRNATAS